MIHSIIEFLSFSDPNIRYVVLGSMLLAASSAVVGVFIVLKKKALIGDAVSHSVLPGICFAFLFSGSKDISLLIIGAFISGWLALILIDLIVKKSKIKKDAAISIVLTVMFGLGIVMLTYIQHHGSASQTGLESFIFGNAAALIGTDVLIFSLIGLILVVVVLAFFKEFALIAFNDSYAKTIGVPVGRLDLLLSTLTVLAVVAGITAVGVVLMAAMLITPAAAARFWSDNLKKIVLLAAVFGALAGFFGALISYLAPSMPTGPWMVITSSVIAFISFFFAPQKGYVFKQLQRKRAMQLADNQNVLKIFYQLGERSDDFSKAYDEADLLDVRQIDHVRLQSAIKRLVRHGLLIKRSESQRILSNKGYKEAARIVRLHRLWELYLARYAKVPAHQVHESAEMIEHMLTPEMEEELEVQLGYPERDPHESVIPRIKD